MEPGESVEVVGCARLGSRERVELGYSLQGSGLALALPLPAALCRLQYNITHYSSPDPNPPRDAAGQTSDLNPDPEHNPKPSSLQVAHPSPNLTLCRLASLPDSVQAGLTP